MQLTLEDVANRFNMKAYREKLINVFVETGVSFNVVESAAFKSLEVWRCAYWLRCAHRVWWNDDTHTMRRRHTVGRRHLFCRRGVHCCVASTSGTPSGSGVARECCSRRKHIWH